MKRFRKWSLALGLVSGLTLSTICCRTSSLTPAPIPDIYFPVFPSPEGQVTLDEALNNVTMSLDYYWAICKYKIAVDEAQSVYRRIQNEQKGF